MNIVQQQLDTCLDSVFSALADPTRRAILRRLGNSEIRVTDLAAPFQISLNSVSKHVRMLERAKLVARRKVGREYRLRFQAEPLLQVEDWVARQRRFWKAGLEALDDLMGEQNRKEPNHEPDR